MAAVPLRHLAVAAHAVPHFDHPVDDLDARRLQQRLPPDRRRARGPDARARDARHPLYPPRPGRPPDGHHRLRHAAGAAADVVHDEESLARRPSMRKLYKESVLLLLAIPILLWTLLPIYHIFLFSISSKDSAFSGALGPATPTLHNFVVVFRQDHFYLHHFWEQIWNSLWIAVAVGVLTLAVATCAAFAISRLKVKGGRIVMNAALFTYFIPAAFLAVPMYKAMGTYGLLNSRWSLVLAMVTLASPYAIWVLKQAPHRLPWEVDEAAPLER